MALNLLNLRIQFDNGVQPVVPGDGHRSMQNCISVLRGMNSGNRPGPTFISMDASAVQATGTVTFASSSGTVGAIINGVTVTVTWATSDTLSAAALAAAINASANALVAGFVTATSALGVVTLTAVNPGLSGNAITLALSGTNVTVSGARLTGGTATTSAFSF